MIIMESMLEEYKGHLQDEGRSRTTAGKYLRDVRKFMRYLAGGTELDKNRVREYKRWLRERYTTASASSMLATVNNFLVFLGREELRVRPYKIRRVLHSRPEREPTESDYKRLIYAAKREGDMWMSMLLQTICSTGIRISELKYITVESSKIGRVGTYNKGKSRLVLLPAELVWVLKHYCNKMNLHAGSIPVARTGRVLDRSNINKRMKQVGEAAGVGTARVFPHSLRHLFAETFYNMEKDMVRLMDLLERSNISTTRIYTMATEELPRQQMARVHLVLGQCENRGKIKRTA